MRKLSALASVAVLSIFVVSAFAALPVMGSTIRVSTAATSTNQDATAHNDKLPPCYEAGLYWFPYFDGKTFGYVTSASATGPYSAEHFINSSSTPLSESDLGWTCTGGKLYYVIVDGTSRTYYRYGIPNANSTITWAIPESYFTTADPSNYPNPIIDTNGNWWIALSMSGASPRMEIWKCASPSSCNWVQSYDGPSGSYGTQGNLVALTGGKLAMISSGRTGFSTEATVITYDGTTWSAGIISAATDYQILRGTTTAIGDTLESCSQTYNGSYGVSYLSYTYGAPSITETVIASGSGSGCGISTDGVSSLSIVYPDSTDSTVYSVTSAGSGGTWDSPQVLSTSESLAQMFASAPSYLNGSFVTEWTNAGGSGPYPVRVGVVSMATTTTTSSTNSTTTTTRAAITTTVTITLLQTTTTTVTETTATTTTEIVGTVVCGQGCTIQQYTTAGVVAGIVGMGLVTSLAMNRKRVKDKKDSRVEA